MNKSQLVDALADRLEDRGVAVSAVDALLEIVVETVRSGDSVSLTGFGVFESRARAARTGRNPRTGETVDVPATTVPAFRPGTGFRNAVAGGDAPARPAPARRPPAAATNGAGADAAAGTGNGAVVPASSPAAAVVADDGPPAAKGGKKGGRKAAGGGAAKDTAKGAAKDKGGKKGKKGKK